MREHTREASHDLGNHDSATHAPNNWLDIWWPVFVIGFGASFVALICSWHPSW